MRLHDCAHENWAEYGGYRICFGCAREWRHQGAMALCPVCGVPVESLHALTAHAIAEHPVPEAVGA